MLHRWIIQLLLLGLLGCMRQQQYVILPPSTAAASLESSRYVVDVSVRQVTNRTRDYGSWRQPWGATLTVDRILRGSEDDVSGTLILRNFRDLTLDERSQFPRSWGFIPGVRLRIGYDRRVGDRFVNLKIVPIGMTPELERTIEAATTRAAR